MSAKKVVPFRMTEAAAKRLLSQIAVKSSNVIFTDHAVSQMKRRKITRPQIISCLRKGLITEAPYLDHHGLWKVRVERYASGENVGCAVAIDNSKQKSIVITAFWVKP
jgi:hypothetical protein